MIQKIYNKFYAILMKIACIDRCLFNRCHLIIHKANYELYLNVISHNIVLILFSVRKKKTKKKP